jgi:hypothetical protein
MPKGAYVNQIHPSHFNDKEAFVAVNNYRQNDWNTYVYHTTDGGKKWRRLNVVGVQGHAHTVVQDRHEEKLVFLGTEGGLFVSFDKGENWQQWKHQFPSVPVFDMKIHPVENDLVVATFGRGCYVIDNIEPLRQAAKNEQRFELFKANPAYLVDTKRPAGSRFPADYVWNGGNKSTAAILNYFMPPAMLDSTGKKEVKVSILSTSGDTLRVFTAKPDTGLNTIYWYYDTQGVRWPSRRPADKNKEPGGGPTVLPGFYTISLAYGDETCSGLLEVRQDPRNEVANDKLIAKQKFTQSVLALADTSGKAFDELQRAKQVIQLVQKQITMLNDTLYKPVSARADSLLKRIAELEGEFMLPEDFKGYNHVTKFLTDYLWDAMSHADNLGPNATEAYEKALTETNRVTSLVSEFFSNEWKAWEQLTSGYNWNVVTAGQKR